MSDSLFYHLGRRMGPKVRKARWMWASATGTTEETVRLEHGVGLDLAHEARQQLQMDADPQTREILDQIGRRLTDRVVNKLRTFRFEGFHCGEPNAFALPGGFIFVSRPILDLCDWNEHEIAFILGHEMGHVLKGHAIERIMTNSAFAAASRAAPVSIPEIFAGKMLGRMLQPALQGGILIAAGVTLFGVNLGDHPTALIPVVLCFAFFCGSLGLLFGVLFRTEQQVNGFGILATMVLAALSGCWWPLEVVPQAFKTIALFLPSHWALQAFHDVMPFGKSWLDVLPECAVLAAAGVALTAVAIPLFHRE
jgi:hypothetical protein